MICASCFKSAGYKLTDITHGRLPIISTQVATDIQFKARTDNSEGSDVVEIKDLLARFGLIKIKLKDKQLLLIKQTVSTDETVLAVTAGRYKGSAKCVLIGTDKRIIQLTNYMISNYPLKNITDLSYLKLGNLYLTTSGEKVLYTEVDKPTAENFVNTISAILY